MTDEAPPLFAGEPEHCALCGEPGHTHDDHWLFQHEPVKALQAKLEHTRLAWQGCREEFTALREESDALELERDILKAQLREYEPSDAVMHQLLGLNEAIAQAARLVEAYVDEQSGWQTDLDKRARDWLALPVVQSARKAMKG